MIRGPVLALALLACLCRPARAGRAALGQRSPGRTLIASLARAPDITPDGLLRAGPGGSLRTLELDDLAPLHLRLTVHF